MIPKTSQIGIIPTESVTVKVTKFVERGDVNFRQKSGSGRGLPRETKLVIDSEI